jgi:hypothetical protein
VNIKALAINPVGCENHCSQMAGKVPPKYFLHWFFSIINIGEDLEIKAMKQPELGQKMTG